MLLIVGIPATVAEGMHPHRDVFCRDEGFIHIERYISGLLLSPNKTLQGIYHQLVLPEDESVSRRAMHQAVFEAGWDVDELMASHRAEVFHHHRGRGHEVVSIDWTLAHHEQSKVIHGAKRFYDYIDNRMATYQTVMTAAIANLLRVDGIVVDLQDPKYEKEELAYLNATVKDSYEEMAEVHHRIKELLHYQKNRLAYRKRTEIAVEIVRQLESEGHFPKAHYAFDNGVLSLTLTRAIEQSGKHWVSELERSRLVPWQDQLAQQWSQTISNRTIGKALKRIGFTRKKNLWLPRTKRCRTGGFSRVAKGLRIFRSGLYGRIRGGGYRRLSLWLE